jgi:hypothetical protein
MWDRVRVELLHARALPWSLLNLPLVFSHEDPLVRKAASSHLRHIADHLHFLATVDLSKLLAEWEHWQDLFKRRFEIGVRSRIDADRFLFVEQQLGRYVDTYGLLNDSFFNLIAIGFFSANLLWEEIVDRLDKQSWATKHEILTRWGWMNTHSDLLRKGNFLPAPYLCSLALKGQHGRKADKEFYQLLHFLHALRAQTGEELLFYAKQETPDFKLKDANGREVGAEMTEVPISEEWYQGQDAAAQVLSLVHAQFKDQFVHIHVRQPLSWLALSDRLSEIQRWISSEVSRLGAIKSKITLENDDLGLKIDLAPAKTLPSGIAWSGSKGPKGLDYIKANSQVMQATLRRKLEESFSGRDNLELLRQLIPVT